MTSDNKTPTKAELVEDILYKWGDMHSHYDIEERNGGFVVVRTFEMDDQTLEEYGLPEEQEVLWRDTLDELHDAIIATRKA